MDLGQIFNKFLKIMQESFGFCFSKLFADDLSQEELIVCLFEAGAYSYDRKGDLSSNLQM